SLTPPAQLIGKTADWQALMKGLSSQQSQRFLILGDAGLGKTTLLQALQAQLQTLYSLNESVATATSRTPSLYPCHLCFFVDALHLLPEEPSRNPAPEQAQELLPTLGIPIGLQLEALRETLQTTLVRSLEDASEGASRVLEWREEQLLTWLREAKQQPSLAERRAFLQVQLKQSCFGHEGLLEKLFKSHHEEVELLEQVLNQPWAYFWLELTEVWLPQLRQHRDQWDAVFVAMADYSKQHFTSQESPVGITLMIDHWDALASATRVLKPLQTELLRYSRTLQDKKQLPCHVVLASRPQRLSQLLGSSLFALFKSKHLLQGVTATEFRQLIAINEDATTPSWTEPALDWLHQHSEGNAFWMLYGHKRLSQAALKEDRKLVDAFWLQQQELLQVQDVFEQTLAQIQLSLLSGGPKAMQALQAVVKTLRCQPLPLSTLITQAQEAYPLLEADPLLTVFRLLYTHGVLVTHPSTDPLTESVPLYIIQHRLMLDVLRLLFLSPNERCLPLETHPHEEAEGEGWANWSSFSETFSYATPEQQKQLDILKVVLPQTLAQGELTLKKLDSLKLLMQEWPNALQAHLHTELMTLLSQTLLDTQQKETVRIQALMALSMLPESEAFEILARYLERQHQASPVGADGYTSLGAGVSTVSPLLASYVLETLHHLLKHYGYFNRPWEQWLPVVQHCVLGIQQQWSDWQISPKAEVFLSDVLAVLPASSLAFFLEEAVQQVQHYSSLQVWVPSSRVALWEKLQLLIKRPTVLEAFSLWLRQLRGLFMQPYKLLPTPSEQTALFEAILGLVKQLPLAQLPNVYTSLLAFWQTPTVTLTCRWKVLQYCLSHGLYDAQRGTLVTEHLHPLLNFVDEHLPQWIHGQADVVEPLSATPSGGAQQSSPHETRHLLMQLIQRLSVTLPDNTPETQRFVEAIVTALQSFSLEHQTDGVYLLLKASIQLMETTPTYQSHLVPVLQRYQQQLKQVMLSPTTVGEAKPMALQLLASSLGGLLTHCLANVPVSTNTNTIIQST
ncbi:MAG: hypothetical protein ACKO34_05570, partial [Vampirovibrionales bacterium]